MFEKEKLSQGLEFWYLDRLFDGQRTNVYFYFAPQKNNHNPLDHFSWFSPPSDFSSRRLGRRPRPRSRATPRGPPRRPSTAGGRRRRSGWRTVPGRSRGWGSWGSRRTLLTGRRHLQLLPPSRQVKDNITVLTLLLFLKICFLLFVVGTKSPL